MDRIEFLHWAGGLLGVQFILGKYSAKRRRGAVELAVDALQNGLLRVHVVTRDESVAGQFRALTPSEGPLPRVAIASVRTGKQMGGIRRYWGFEWQPAPSTDYSTQRENVCAFVEWLLPLSGLTLNVGPARQRFREEMAGPSMVRLVEEARSEVGESEQTSHDAEDEFDPSLVAAGRLRIAREIAVRQGQQPFRAALLARYGCCVFTGCGVDMALEAAHIVPYQGPHSNAVDNGLLLRADIHTLFDCGYLAVDPETLKILVAPTLNGTEYEILHGQQLRVRDDLAPSRKALAFHRSRYLP